jgi:hypothetical protein
MDQGVLGVTADRGGDLASLVGYQEWTAPEFRSESGEPLLDVGVDGEALRLPPPLVFRSMPGALRI